MAVCRRMPEMAEADVIECGRRLKARDVTAKLRAFLVGTQNDGKCVPPDDGAKLVLDRAIARQHRLLVRRDRVAIRRCQRLLYLKPTAARGVDHRTDDELGSFIAAVASDRRQGVEPFQGFRRIQIMRVRNLHYPLHRRQSRSQASTFIAVRIRAETRNATQAISPGALGDELNTGWHLNVPSRRLFLSCRFFCGYLSSNRARLGKARPMARMPFFLLEFAIASRRTRLCCRSGSV